MNLETSITSKISVYIENYIYPSVYVCKNKFNQTKPYEVKDSRTSRLLQNFSTHKEARKYIASFVHNDTAEQEIVVWIRAFGDLLKDDIITSLKQKFHITEEYANRLFYLANPTYLNENEVEEISKLKESFLLISDNDAFELRKAYTNISMNNVDLNFNIEDTAFFNGVENLFLCLLQERSIL